MITMLTHNETQARTVPLSPVFFLISLAVKSKWTLVTGYSIIHEIYRINASLISK